MARKHKPTAEQRQQIEYRRQAVMAACAISLTEYRQRLASMVPSRTVIFHQPEYQQFRFGR